MEHRFDVELAQKYGIEAAIVIKNFQFWIANNKDKNQNFYDGRTWTYNTLEEFSDLFPYWSKYKIHRIFDTLVEQKILIKGNYNQNTHNRTLWYAFSDETLFLSEKMHIAELQNAYCKNAKSKLQNCNMEVAELQNPFCETAICLKEQIINTDNIPDNKPDIYSFVKEEFDLSELLLNLIIKRKKDFKKPDLNKWAKIISRMVKIDKRDLQQIEKVIRWCQQDEFWQNNILSTEKLRKHFDTLEMRMQKNKTGIFYPEQEKFSEKTSAYGVVIEV